MNVTNEMYTTLFNELTNIMEELERLKGKIKNVQIQTEEMYMKNERIL